VQIIVIAPVVLILAFVLGELFRKASLPSVIGQILAGIILGIPVLKHLLFSDESSLLIVDFLAELGLSLE